MRTRLLVGLAACLVAVLPTAARASLVIVLPSNPTLEAEGPHGAAYAFEAYFINPVGKRRELVCEPASGAVFPFGETIVSCSGDDPEGEVRGTFVVTVVDTTPPSVGAMSDLVREADGPAGSVASFSAPEAVDSVDGVLPTVCVPPSGSVFALGTTSVACSATDTRGNVGTAAFAVTVRDTTPPVLVPPADRTVAATSAGGIAASDPAAASFLAGARTSDLVTEAPVLTHDAPPVFPPGTTTVTFTAVDAAGNSATARARLTVTPRPAGAPPPPVTPPQPPAPDDRTPPADVGRLTATAGDRSVTLTWRSPPDRDFDHVLVYRHAALQDASTARVVYRGAAERLLDRGLANGTEYRYVVVSVDRSRNPSRGVAVTATPVQPQLLQPKAGARVQGPPVLRWRAVKGASYYNVQLYRGSRKVLTAWPASARLPLQAQWRSEGRTQRLAPGTYRWYVWPGFGPRPQARYGELLGGSTFTVVAARK